MKEFLKKIYEFLERLEWNVDSSCPMCGHSYDKHYKDCELKQVMNEIKEKAGMNGL